MNLTLAEAQARLPDLIRGMTPGDEVAITENDRMIAKLIVPQAEKPQRVPGRGKGTLTILVEDDEHLEDFQEYLP